MAKLYNRYAVPTGRVNANRNVSNVTADARAKASARSYVATCQLRSKLKEAKVLFIDDSWAIVRGGAVVARFATVSDAVAAL